MITTFIYDLKQRYLPLIRTFTKTKSLLLLVASQILFLFSFIIILKIVLIKPRLKPIISPATNLLFEVDENNYKIEHILDDRCQVVFLILTAPRPPIEGDKFYYLGRTVDSLARVKQRLFYPCIVVLNSKGEPFREEVERTVKQNTHDSQTYLIHKRYSYNMFMNSDLSERKRLQSNDFYDMIRLFHENMKTRSNVPVVIMEDDFIMCPGAISHLSLIFEKATQLEIEGRDWAGIRFSFGMNGVMIQRKDFNALIHFMELQQYTNIPIDWLLEEFFHRFHDYGKEYFKDRLFYLYRYQLMKHIGVMSSVGNERNVERNNVDFPHCFEPQTQSQLYVLFHSEQCPNSLFFPCNDTNPIPISAMAGRAISEDPEYVFTHDTLTLPSSPPSHKFSLYELKNVESVACEKGESCATCCEKRGSICDGRFFPYINRCEEIKKFSPNCKCVYERNPVQDSSSPLFDETVCMLGTRNSRFRCQNSEYRRRVCPCVNKLRKI